MTAKTIRIFICALGAILFLGLSPNHSLAQTGAGFQAIRVANGLSQPLFAAAAPGDYDRLFIVTKLGYIYILNLNAGTLNSTPFLDLHNSVGTDSEEGLVGLAFDPNYSTNGKFYVNYVAPGDANRAGITRISQFAVSIGDANVADPNSEKNLLSFDQPEANHNGGWIGFSQRAGDDNNLYIATGDGGNGNDSGTGHIEPGGNAQNLTTLLGKMLRIHVNSAAGTTSIPASNPFINVSGARPEIFAYGLRNPFRNSFDRATNTLFIGDVGQDTREEVDVQKPSNPGGAENYGWRLREGTIATPTGGVGGNKPADNVEPLVDYPHFNSSISLSGNTVTGGYVYRGKQMPGLLGTYVFGDYSNNKIFSLNYDGTSASNFHEITSQFFPTASGGYGLSGPASFGEDANGEIYVVAINTGSVFRLAPTTPNIDVRSITKSGGSVSISAIGVPFKTHTILATDSLTTAFAAIGSAQAGGNGIVQFQDSNPGTHRFYNVSYP